MFFTLAALAIFGHRLTPSLWTLGLAVLLGTLTNGRLDYCYRQLVMAWPFFILVGSSPRSPWLKGGFLALEAYLAWAWFLPLWRQGGLV